MKPKSYRHVILRARPTKRANKFIQPVTAATSATALKTSRPNLLPKTRTASKAAAILNFTTPTTSKISVRQFTSKIAAVRGIGSARAMLMLSKKAAKNQQTAQAHLNANTVNLSWTLAIVCLQVLPPDSISAQSAPATHLHGSIASS